MAWHFKTNYTYFINTNTIGNEFWQTVSWKSSENILKSETTKSTNFVSIANN
ncbi:MAG: hypothetical protein IPL21_07465 [Saprospirales bacterium]|nr:hypothetical protein [Saprospirales bacterium]